MLAARFSIDAFSSGVINTVVRAVFIESLLRREGSEASRTLQ
jgi:hypothetical protein